MGNLDYMKDYSGVIMNGINGITDTIDSNRKQKEFLAQQQLENQFGQRKYSDALMQDQRDFQFKQSEAARDQRNADRTYGQGLTTADIKEYQYAKRNGFEGGFKDWMTVKGAASGTGNFFGTPLPTQGEDGAAGYALPSKTGDVRGLVPPAGTKFLSPLDKAAMTAEGKVTGAAAGALPNTLRSVDRLIDSTDDLLNDPDLSTITGPIQGRLPNTSAGAARAQSRLDMVRGGAFLQAYNDLRGAGQIANQEGQAAQAAYHRLTEAAQTMGDEDFRVAVQDFAGELKRLRDIAVQKASAGGYRAPGSGQPQQAPAQGGGWSVQQVQ